MERYKVSFQLYLGTLIKTVRRRNGVSQEAMAEWLHISVRSYSDLERSRSCVSTQTFIFLLFLLTAEDILQLVADLRRLAEEAEHDAM